MTFIFFNFSGIIFNHGAVMRLKYLIDKQIYA